MKLELHGMGFTLPGISTDPLKTVTINDPIKPVTYVPTTTTTKPPLINRILDFTRKTTDVINQVVRPGAPQPATQYQTTQAPAEPPLPQEDNTGLYLALAGGALGLGVLTAIVLKKKKKKRGMGRVRRRATKTKSRAPRKRTVTRSRKRKATKRKTSKRRR